MPSLVPTRPARTLHALRLIAVLALLVVSACSRDGAPSQAGAPPALAAAPAPSAPTAAVDFADVVRRIGLRFRPDGDGFRGGQPAYEVRVRAAETRFAPRVPARAGRAAPPSAALVLGAAVITRAGGSAVAASAAVHEREHGLEIDRGLAVERLENTEGGLEQSFRFATRPAGSGAVAVRVPVSGMRYAGATARGLHFAGEGGLGSRYGAALWIDARGERTPIAVAHEASAIVLTVPAALVEKSAYPAVLDPTIGPEIGIDNPIYATAQGNQTVQAVSYAGGQHLVAYNDGSLWVTRVSAAGVVLDPYGILVCAKPSNGWPYTAIAHDGTNWMVAWMDNRTGALDMYGARVSAAGAVLDPNGVRLITATSFTGRLYPSLSYGGGSYLLAYSEGNTARAQIVSTAAAPVGTPFVVQSAMTSFAATATAFNGTDHLVAFAGVDGGTNVVYARRVSPAGFTVGSTVYPVTSTGNGPIGLATNGTDWMLSHRSTGSQIRVSRVTAASGTPDAATDGVAIAGSITGNTTVPIVWDGSHYEVYWDSAGDISAARITPATTVAASASNIIGEAGNATRPFVSFDPVNGNALLGFSDDRLASTFNTGDGRFTRVTTAFARLDDPTELLTKGSNYERFADVAWNGSSWLVVWLDTRGADIDLYGARLDATGAMLDPAGIAIAATTGVPDRISVGSNGSGWLVAWENGSGNIAAARVSGAGAVLDGTPLLLGAGNGPRVAGGSSDYAVVWFDYNTNYRVLGRRVSAGGTILDPMQIVIAADGYWPGIGWNGTSWLLPYTTTTGLNAGSVHARRLYADGSVDASPIPITSAPPTGGDFSVAALGGQWLVTWNQSTDIRAIRISAAGAKVDASSFVVSNALNDQTRPRAASDGTNYWIVWQDARVDANSADVYGTRVSPAGAVLDPSGLAISATTYDEIAPSIAGGPAGTLLVAYHHLAGTPSSDAVRVFGRIITAAASGGTSCATGGECASGSCVDGVCCDTACTGLCQACTAAKKGSGANGVCGPIGAGADPDNECAAQAASTCGTTGTCNGAGACALWPSGTSCGAATCQGSVIKAQICSGTGTCGLGAGGTDCAPYACSAGACKTTCAGAADCAAGYVCIGGACTSPLADGATCAASSECGSGSCVDGVCCDTPCTGLCQACTTAKKGGGANGACGPIGAGTDPDDECAAQAASTCGTNGSCDGVGACQLHPAGTSCAADVCVGNLSTPKICDGTGSCVNGAGTACAPYVCSLGACKNPCGASSNCLSGNVCVAGVCMPPQGNGAPCTAASQCASGFCADGVCCDAACNGLCQACTIAKKSSGANGVCGPAFGGTDPDNECAQQAQSTCGTNGSCNGVGACQRWAAGTSCGSSVCQGNVVTGQICDGNGTCTAPPGGQDCAPYVCAGGACKNPCATASDCVAGYFCNAGACQKVGDPGSPCTAATQCASGFCVDGVCCDAACNGPCQACSAGAKGQGTNGACGPVAAGSDPHDDCAPTAPSTCGHDGACNGNGACAPFAAGTVCTPAACTAGVETKDAHCDGQGVCLAGTTSPCDAGYVCVGSVCATSCSDDSACAAGYHCVASTCAAEAPDGGTDAGTGGAGGATSSSSTSSSTTSSSTSSSGAGGQAGTGGAGGTASTTSSSSGAGGQGATGGQGGGPFGKQEEAGNCGCRAVGSEADPAAWSAAAVLAALAGMRRRRQRNGGIEPCTFPAP
jgi:hypothetical protein